MWNVRPRSFLYFPTLVSIYLRPIGWRNSISPCSPHCGVPVYSTVSHWKRREYLSSGRWLEDSNAQCIRKWKLWLRNILDRARGRNQIGCASGLTSLHLAADGGHYDIVIVLVEKGADINKVADINKADKGGWTALHLAANRGHCDIVRVSVEKGADINLPDHRGWTALHFAHYIYAGFKRFQQDHHDLARFLMVNGTTAPSRLQLLS